MVKAFMATATVGLALLVPAACDRLVPTPTTPDTPKTTTTRVDQPVTPGAVCVPEGAQGKTAGGTVMECKRSDDGRNRWREFQPGIEVK